MMISFEHEETGAYITVEDLVGAPSAGDKVQTEDSGEHTTVHAVLWQPRSLEEDGRESSMVVYHS